MIETTAFSLGFLAGVLFGSIIVGFLVAAKVRGRLQSELFASGERAQRAETLAGELRRQVDDQRADLDRVREEALLLSNARAVAETQAAETVRHVEEQKTLLAQARQDLAEAFQALSGEALKQNNEAFLNLAKTSFQTLQAEAKGDFARSRQAIDELVKPLN